jgi:hypothetical protein
MANGSGWARRTFARRFTRHGIGRGRKRLSCYGIAGGYCGNMGAVRGQIMLRRGKVFIMLGNFSTAPTFTREGSQVRSLHRPPSPSTEQVIDTVGEKPACLRLVDTLVGLFSRRFTTKPNVNKRCGLGENPGTARAQCSRRVRGQLKEREHERA